MENSNIDIDPDAEVKKLQDLVKKLERQNQVLRNKQNSENQQQSVQTQKNVSSINKTPENHVIPTKGIENCDDNYVKKSRTSAITEPTDNKKDHVNNITLESIDLVDLGNQSQEEEEENWLVFFYVCM